MRAALVLATLLAVAACGGEPPPEPTFGVASEAPLTGGPTRRFAFTTLDGRPVSQSVYAGRMTLIALVATYDTASQAQARFVQTVYTRHQPRVNALLLVLEPDHHAPLVQAFAQSLGLSYDVALSGSETIAGKGPFPGLHHVPSVVMLDREGREVWRNLGVASQEELRDALREHDPRSR